MGSRQANHWLPAAVAVSCWALGVCSMSVSREALAAERTHGHAAAEHEPGEINWFRGILAETDEPIGEGPLEQVLFRPTGMPVPLGAMLLNTLIFFGLLVKFARQPIREALTRRKREITRGFEEAAKMKGDAETELRDYEAKLSRVDSEVARIKAEALAFRKAEEQRLLAEAARARTRMVRDAHVLVEQELKAAHEALHRETVKRAFSAARQAIDAQVGVAEQDRLQATYLSELEHWTPESIRSST